MNKTIVTICSLLSISAFAQTSPLENHISSVLTEFESKNVWREMRTDFNSGSECFNRAMSWTYDINKRYGYEAKKILIHYSYKYNKELSAKWGFHIAPMYNIEGNDTVFDKGFFPWLHAPLTPKMWQEKFLTTGEQKLVEHRIKISNKIKKLKNEIDELDRSSEFYFETLWKKQEKIQEHKDKLKEFKITDTDLLKQKPKKIAKINNWIKYLKEEIKFSMHPAVRRSLKAQLDYQLLLLKKVENDLDYAAYIECKKIDSIEELDYNQNGAWCYIQEVSQYYWGVPQLRKLNYGPGHGMNTLPLVSDLPQARQEGSAYAHKNRFDMEEVWAARAQAFKSYKKIWAEEYEQKKQSEQAVKKVYKHTKKISNNKVKAQRLLKKINKLKDVNHYEIPRYLETAQQLMDYILKADMRALLLQEKIYEVKFSLQVADVKQKVQNFEKILEYDQNVEKKFGLLEFIHKQMKELSRD